MTLPPQSSNQMRTAYSSYRCQPSSMVTVAFPGAGHEWRLLVAKPTVPAWIAFTEVMARHDVLFKETAGGTYNCRAIAGSSVYSLHAYGLALDLNPSDNPQGYPVDTAFTEAFTDQVKELHTAGGRRIFQWGGDWSSTTPPDPMHFQIGATPTELGSGIIDPNATQEDDVTPEDKQDIINGTVAKLQKDGVKLTRSAYNASTIFAAVWARVPSAKPVKGSMRWMLNRVHREVTTEDVEPVAPTSATVDDRAVAAQMDAEQGAD